MTFLERLEGHPRWTSWDTSIEDVRAQLTGMTTVTYPEAIEAAYVAYAQNRNKKRYGDKTPRYIEDTHTPLPALARGEVRASRSRWQRGGTELCGRPVRSQHRCEGSRAVEGTGQARAWSGAAPWAPRRYTELRYERLLANPQEEVEDLCSFLDLEFDPAMLDYSERARSEVLDRAKLYNPNVMRSITKTRSWDEQMPRSQVEVFEAVAGDTLTELGYERAFPSPSLARSHWPRLRDAPVCRSAGW